MTRTPTPTTKLQQRGHARARNLRRDVLSSILQAVDDAGLSRRSVCDAAGIGPNTLAALERDDREPTIEVLSRLATALGGELSVRFHPGSGPALRDHLQAAMVEGLLGQRSTRWMAEVEVRVFTPSPGVIDVVLRDGLGSVIACEAQSEIRRLEQQIRWARAKAEALPRKVGEAETSRILLLRTSPATRALVSTYPTTFRVAYPVSHRDAVAALVGDAAWIGAAIVWMDVQRGVATVRDRPPRGVPVW